MALQDSPAGADWRSDKPPVTARLAATGEAVEDDYAWMSTEANTLNLTEMVAEQAPSLPIGSGFRRTRLWDLSEDAENPDSPAVMRVVVVDPVGEGRIVPGAQIVPDYSQFFLESVNEQDVEKAHIVETFGTYWVHLFGRKPRVFTFSGTLVSAHNQQWEAAWDLLYENFLRGTRLVELGAQAQLTYGGRSVYGYLLGSNKQKQAVSDKSVPFTFSILVTHVEWVAQQRILESQFGVSSIAGISNSPRTLAEAAAVVAGDDADAGAQLAESLSGAQDTTRISRDDAATIEARLAALGDS